MATNIPDDELGHFVHIDPVSGWLVASQSLVLDINSTLNAHLEAKDHSRIASSQRYLKRDH